MEEGGVILEDFSSDEADRFTANFRESKQLRNRFASPILAGNRPEDSPPKSVFSQHHARSITFISARRDRTSTDVVGANYQSC
jgi:hypothetical protein